MQHGIELYINGLKVPVEAFQYSGGEIAVTCDLENADPSELSTVIARLQTPNDYFVLMHLTSMLYARGDVMKKLVIPYFPYAREDRFEKKGRSVGLRQYAQLINNLKYDQVYVLDAHSNVAPMLLDRYLEIPQWYGMCLHQTLDAWVGLSDPLLIAPDAGASKKTCQYEENQLNLKDVDESNVIQCLKIRSKETGLVTESLLSQPERIRGRHCLIVDDICDGGSTFISLAKEIRKHEPREISLYVTHGIFRNGVEELLDHIDRIFTTNSFASDVVKENKQRYLYVEDVKRIIQPFNLI